ncbi:glycosyl transferase [Mucilaginibacter sp. 21P]|uniref:hypothetical protein n=1 Tax=Mucilaginibacter sp. 21P TaxID=2778902 RepID=UPI001C584468|nr:hypothetical protein [Mucilaginibacter sp. 21P]QXV67507.1 glycosyl transferase [Mucilaginibacter sp. 21P]
MSPGTLLYNLYYRPLGFLRKLFEVGIFNYVDIRRSQSKMIAGSLTINEIVNGLDKATYEVYFLTGKRYWYQTAFCLYSLQKVCTTIRITAKFIDDGSINEKLKKQIIKQFPSSIVITAADTEALLDAGLPWQSYPRIRAKRETYPHLKKLTDVHIHSGDWKLVLDSDMLFFKYPKELLDWINNPSKPFFLKDPITSYHYSFNLMEELTGKRITPNLNVGVIGLNSKKINWDALENWIAELEKKEGTSYLLEQALSAMIVAGEDIIIADPSVYMVMPCEQEVRQLTSALHHYVAQSKEWYYKLAWKSIA